MKRYLIASLALVLVAVVLVTVGYRQYAWAHCQMPCGIYDDEARIQAMLEDVMTIGKAMDQINGMAGRTDPQSINQATRWVNTKEEHASHVITTVGEYFLTQKVTDVPPGSPEYPGYLESLAAHHRVLRAAMKTKQTTDPASVAVLEAAIKDMSRFYGHAKQPLPPPPPPPHKH